MKKSLLLSVQSLIAATLVSLTAGVQPLSAQDAITLKKSDFSVPTWTKLLRTSKATDGKLPFSINMTMNGDLVKIARNSNEVNVSSLATGMYVVKITAGNDLFFSKVMKK